MDVLVKGSPGLLILCREDAREKEKHGNGRRDTDPRQNTMGNPHAWISLRIVEEVNFRGQGSHNSQIRHAAEILIDRRRTSLG
jgi:hypothetical protein